MSILQKFSELNKASVEIERRTRFYSYTRYYGRVWLVAKSLICLI